MKKGENTDEKIKVAARLREIRKNAGYTQESFAEILEISLSAYKKVESAENHISIDGLRKLEQELNISADYVLFGTSGSIEDVWKTISNCSEIDKLSLMIRLIIYFAEIKKARFCKESEQKEYSLVALDILKEMISKGE